MSLLHLDQDPKGITIKNFKKIGTGNYSINRNISLFFFLFFFMGFFTPGSGTKSFMQIRLRIQAIRHNADPRGSRSKKLTSTAYKFSGEFFYNRTYNLPVNDYRHLLVDFCYLQDSIISEYDVRNKLSV